MQDEVLDVSDDVSRVGLIPTAIEVFCHQSELDDEVVGQVLGLDLAALFSP
jgi:hypothetical protein